MPVLHSHKTIMLHPCRTAGTSIEKYLGIPSKDLWRKIYVGDKKIKGLQHGNLDDIHNFKEHLSINKEQLNSYFKFCFVRNPYDYVVSYWMWRKIKKNENIKFYEFVEKIEFEFFTNNKKYHNENKESFDTGYRLMSYYTHKNNKKVVDFIGRFENVESDFSKLCSIIKFKKQDMPHEMASAVENKSSLTRKESILYKEKKPHYSKFYNLNLTKRVESIFKKDLEIFNYSFEEKIS